MNEYMNWLKLHPRQPVVVYYRTVEKDFFGAINTDIVNNVYGS